MCREGEVMWEDIHCGLNVISPRSGKKNKFGHFLVIVQLIHRLTQADISCTKTARLLFFPLLDDIHPVPRKKLPLDGLADRRRWRSEEQRRRLKWSQRRRLAADIKGTLFPRSNQLKVQPRRKFTPVPRRPSSHHVLAE